MKTFLSRFTAALTLAAYTTSPAIGSNAFAGEEQSLSKDWARAAQIYTDVSQKDKNTARQEMMKILKNRGLSDSFLYELNHDLKTSLKLPQVKIEGKTLVVSSEGSSVTVEQVNSLTNEFLVNGERFIFVPDMGYSYNYKKLEEILSPKSKFSWNPIEWLFPKAHALEPTTIGLIIAGIAVVAAIWIAVKAKSEAKDARADAQRAISSAFNAQSSVDSLASKVKTSEENIDVLQDHDVKHYNAIGELKSASAGT